MKRRLIIILVFLMAFSNANLLEANADNYENGFHAYDNGDGTVTIYWYEGQDKDLVIPDTIGGKSVTGIGNAFSNKGLTSVVIPDSVKNIGNHAFYINELTDVIIPSSVTSVGEGAFSSNKLTSVSIPNSVTTIEKDTFYYNPLTNVTIPDSVTTIEDYAFASNQLTTLIIPNSVTSIGENAFSQNKLTTLEIPNSVVNIEKSAFANNGLTEVVIPDSITSIKDYVFYNNKLTNVTIPDSVTSIEMFAFRQNQLTDVTISKNVKSIGEHAFSDNWLSAIAIPDRVTNIGNYAFTNNQLQSVTIPDSITWIGENVFSNNQLQSVVIPNRVTGIGNYAFHNNQLQSVTLPESVTSIGTSAFSENKLQMITIPENVTDIGSTAFHINQLQSVKIFNKEVNFGGSYVFTGNPNIVIYSPSDSTAKTYAEQNGHKWGMLYIAVEGVMTSHATLNLIAGGAPETLTATVTPANATNKNVTWESGNPAVAEVDANGVVTPKSEGVTLITATTVDGNISASSVVFVAPAVKVTGVTLNQGSLNLVVGGTPEKLVATVAPADATNQDVTWESSNPAVAEVDDNGVVTPRTAGTATITVTTVDGNKTASSVVTVSNPVVAVTGVTLNQGSLNLIAGGAPETLAATVTPVNATNQDVTWESSNPAVAEVDDNGVVTPKTAGTATITVTTVDGNKTASSVVTVSNPVVAVTGVTLNQGSLNLIAGGASETLAATVTPTDATNQDVTWESSNPAVADVDGNGVVTPRTAGTATITVTTVDGNKTASNVVTVSNPVVKVTGVTLDQGSLNLIAGGASETLIAAVTPVNATNQDVAWSSSNPAVADVDGNGVVTPRTAGTATITVTTVDGSFTAAVTVNVRPRPSSGGGGGGDGGSNNPPAHSTNPATPKQAEQGSVNAENVGTTTTTVVNGQTRTIISVDPKNIEEKLAAGGIRTVLTISTDTKSNALVGELTAQMIANMQKKQAIIELKTAEITYTLPAQQVSIETISGLIGRDMDLKDIKIQIEISRPASETVKIIENASEKGNFTVLMEPINFTVKGIYGNETIEISTFKTYIERTIAIPDDVAPNKKITGIVVEQDGTVRHVPTKIVTVNGKRFAQINSLTNSTYALVEHSRRFTDVEQHWAKDAVNDMGSRLIISGVDHVTFNPDRDITRAEFAAIIIRALGVKPDGKDSLFKDVQMADWYSGAVQAASAYNLISGFEEGTFHPMDKITREQAMTIIARAMKLTDLQAAGSAEMLLSFTDASDVAVWAREGIADCLQVGLISGRSGKRLAPKEYISRAEAATIVQRLLQKSELIN
ncbi:leucine-rich repeat protein [Paenibacillus dakarensis]|uniref:leucine-rich repeat protein n=1 Tax=Paenibacillus dakarensis TaxID=1527293 RepID=UPI0006D55D0C|nr:leucine-rich repeat protein [Paenibacillus dakarensis]